MNIHDLTSKKQKNTQNEENLNGFSKILDIEDLSLQTSDNNQKMINMKLKIKYFLKLCKYHKNKQKKM